MLAQGKLEGDDVLLAEVGEPENKVLLWDVETFIIAAKELRAVIVGVEQLVSEETSKHYRSAFGSLAVMLFAVGRRRLTRCTLWA